MCVSSFKQTLVTHQFLIEISPKWQVTQLSQCQKHPESFSLFSCIVLKKSQFLVQKFDFFLVTFIGKTFSPIFVFFYKKYDYFFFSCLGHPKLIKTVNLQLKLLKFKVRLIKKCSQTSVITAHRHRCHQREEKVYISRKSFLNHFQP